MLEGELKPIAREVRQDILTMCYEAGAGHPGGSLSAVEILVYLYWELLKIDPKNPTWTERDYFVLSKGHITPVIYSVLARRGFFEIKELKTYRQVNSRLQGHASRVDLPGLESSAGSLGQGLGIACGIAQGLKMDQKSNRVYCLMGDGEQQEGSIWESAMFAGFYHLDNLIGIIDRNKVQLSANTEKTMSLEPLKEKYASFGWEVIELDGHSFLALEKGFKQALKTKGKPILIIANTIKGKGVSFMENQASWHGKAPNQEEYEQAMKELNTNI